MPTSRYAFAKPTPDGKALTQSKASHRVFKAVNAGVISVQTKVLEEGERLDQLAGLYYGNGELWWMIAAASGIGWGLQAAPGTILRIPIDASQVFGVLL